MASGVDRDDSASTLCRPSEWWCAFGLVFPSSPRSLHTKSKLKTSTSRTNHILVGLLASWLRWPCTGHTTKRPVSTNRPAQDNDSSFPSCAGSVQGLCRSGELHRPKGSCSGSSGVGSSASNSTMSPYSHLQCPAQALILRRLPSCAGPLPAQVAVNHDTQVPCSTSRCPMCHAGPALVLRMVLVQVAGRLIDSPCIDSSNHILPFSLCH